MKIVSREACFDLVVTVCAPYVGSFGGVGGGERNTRHIANSDRRGHIAIVQSSES